MKKKRRKATKNEAEKDAFAFVRAWHNETAPNLFPEYVQRKLVLEITPPEGKAFKERWNLIGYSDYEERIAVNDTHYFTTVRDFKTTRRTPPGNPADLDMQLTIYALAKSIMDGNVPHNVHLDYAVRLKNEVKAVSFVSKRGQADFRSAWRRIEPAIRMIESGIFMPCNPLDWCCSDRWCGYWDSICDCGRRDRKVIPV